jgi:hypothetical protein
MKRNKENIEEQLMSDIANNFTISGQVNDVSQLFPLQTSKRSLQNGLIFILVLNGEGTIKIDRERTSCLQRNSSFCSSFPSIRRNSFLGRF